MGEASLRARRKIAQFMCGEAGAGSLEERPYPFYSASVDPKQ